MQRHQGPQWFYIRICLDKMLCWCFYINIRTVRTERDSQITIRSTTSHFKKKVWIKISWSIAVVTSAIILDAWCVHLCLVSMCCPILWNISSAILDNISNKKTNLCKVGGVSGVKFHLIGKHYLWWCSSRSSLLIQKQHKSCRKLRWHKHKNIKDVKHRRYQFRDLTSQKKINS